jgi:hypothetical protein
MLKDIGNLVDGQSAKRIKDLLQKVRSPSYRNLPLTNFITSITPIQTMGLIQRPMCLTIGMGPSDPLHLLPLGP